jgi:hypothetical protein
MIVSIIVPFFELRDGNLYSNRMEREKAKSELARKSVQARIDKATSTKSLSNRSSNRSSKSPSQKARKPESQNTEEKDSLPTLSQEPEITAPKPEPKTTERDTQPRTVVMTPGRTFELSEDLTDAVLEIGLAHPKNYRFIGLPAERFPWDQTTEILDAIERDGKDAVLAGVRNLRDCFKRRPRSDLTFAPEPKKFFHESEYLKDPIEWERIDAKQFDSRTKAQRDQDATVDAPSVRNAETMLGAEFSSANISRFEIKDCSAFLTRFFHGFILACQKLHCALYLRMFVDSVIYCQRAEREIDIPTLFELTDPEQGAEASA